MVDSVQIYSARFCLPGGWVVEPILVTSQSLAESRWSVWSPQKNTILHKTQWASLLIWKILVNMLIVKPGDGSIPIDTFLVGWTSIYQLFWGSLGTRVLTHPHLTCSFVWWLNPTWSHPFVDDGNIESPCNLLIDFLVEPCWAPSFRASQNSMTVKCFPWISTDPFFSPLCSSNKNSTRQLAGSTSGQGQKLAPFICLWLVYNPIIKMIIPW